MGWTRKELTPEILARMTPEDARMYSPGIHPPYQDDHHPPVKTDSLERDEQRNFATECLQRGWRFVWHKTHKRSTANVGCPDFIVAAKATTFWIEFKRVGEDLSPDQEAFKKQLAQNGITMYVVFSAFEAAQVIDQYNPGELFLYDIL
jgi:VRR-NUC domain